MPAFPGSSSSDRGYGKGYGGKGGYSGSKGSSFGSTLSSKGGGFGASRGGGRSSRGRGGRYDNSWGGRGRLGAGKGGRGGPSALPTQQAKLMGHTATVSCIEVAEGRKQLFSGGSDGKVRLWSWEQNFECVHVVDVGAPVEAILVFDDWLFAGTQAVGGRQGVVRVWHMGNGFEQALEGHQGTIWCLAQGGTYLFSGGVCCLSFICKMASNLLIARGHGSPIKASPVVASNADDPPGDDMGIKTWQFNEQPAGFAPVVELKGHTAPIQVR